MNNKNQAIILIGIVIVLFVLLFLDFTALHDINKEYVSRSILESLSVKLSNEIPKWTENAREWKYLNFSILMKIVFYTILLALGVYIYRK